MSDVCIVPSGKKTFVPLENNPEVLTRLARQLGAAPTLAFHDVYSLDEPALLALVPRPVHALLFLCPARVYHATLGEENARLPQYTGAGAGEPIVWFRQTIGHACGLIALLHALANGPARAHVVPGSDLDVLLRAAEPLDPTARAALLYDSAVLEAAHMAAAVRGDSVAPRPEEDNDLHYVCFVKGKDGQLWDLDGGRPGPVSRGLLETEDMLSEEALQMGVRSFLAKQAAGGGDLRFSLVALTSGTAA